MSRDDCVAILITPKKENKHIKEYRVAWLGAPDNYSYYKNSEVLEPLKEWLLVCFPKSKVYTSLDLAYASARSLEDETGPTEYGIIILDRCPISFP